MCWTPPPVQPRRNDGRVAPDPVAPCRSCGPCRGADRDHRRADRTLRMGRFFVDELSRWTFSPSPVRSFGTRQDHPGKGLHHVWDGLSASTTVTSLALLDCDDLGPAPSAQRRKCICGSARPCARSRYVRSLASQLRRRGTWAESCVERRPRPDWDPGGELCRLACARRWHRQWTRPCSRPARRRHAPRRPRPQPRRNHRAIAATSKRKMNPSRKILMSLLGNIARRYARFDYEKLPLGDIHVRLGGNRISSRRSYMRACDFVRENRGFCC